MSILLGSLFLTHILLELFLSPFIKQYLLYSRLYNIALKKGPKLVQILSIGIKPSGQLAGRDILDSLGDTAVDFTPIPDSETLLLLRGNGDVYMMQCELDRKR